MADQARRTGHLLFVDTSGEALSKAVQEGVYMIKPNMRELAELAGHEIETQSQKEKVLQKVIEEGRAEIVVVSLGAAGALFATRETFERIPAPTVKIRSKVVLAIACSRASYWH